MTNPEIMVPHRPDRYIDWDRFRSLPPNGGNAHSNPDTEKWASVAVKIAGSGDDLLTELTAFQEIFNERIQRGTEHEENSTFTPEISKTELARLSQNIESLSFKPSPDGSETQPISLGATNQYYIYLPENQIYDDTSAGAFKVHGAISVLHASPVVPNFKRTRPEGLGKISLPSTEAIVPTVGIGIIDDGIAFLHERFGDRVDRVWLQDGEHQQEEDDNASYHEVAFGKVLDTGKLDELRKKLGSGASEDQIYAEENSIVTSSTQAQHPSTAFRLAHGTHVLDLASGASPDHQEGQPRICAVQLPPSVTADTSGRQLAHYVLHGLTEIIGWANSHKNGPLPLVINFSYGYSAGPKDGSSFLEREIDRLVTDRHKNMAPTMFVLPAGNNYEARTTARIELAGESGKTIDWIILPDDATDNFLEIWVDPASEPSTAPKQYKPLKIKVTAPNGVSYDRLTLHDNQMAALKMDQGAVAGVYFDSIEFPEGSGNYRYRYFLAVNRTKDFDDSIALAPAGRWRIELSKADDGTDCDAHLYIQRDDTPAGYRKTGRQSYFDHEAAYQNHENTGDYRKLAPNCPIKGEGSLSAIGNGSCSIVVGGVENSTGYPPAKYSASGPTKKKSGPFMSAISDETSVHRGILAAGTRSGSYVAMNGTSVSAPQVARWISEQMSQKKITKGMSYEDIRKLLLDTSLVTASQNGNAVELGEIDPRRGKAILTPKRYLAEERVYSHND